MNVDQFFINNPHLDQAFEVLGYIFPSMDAAKAYTGGVTGQSIITHARDGYVIADSTDVEDIIKQILVLEEEAEKIEAQFQSVLTEDQHEIIKRWADIKERIGKLRSYHCKLVVKSIRDEQDAEEFNDLLSNGPEKVLDGAGDDPATEKALDGAGDNPDPEKVPDGAGDDPATEKALDGAGDNPDPEKVPDGAGDDPATEKALDGAGDNPDPEKALDGTGDDPATEKTLDGAGDNPDPGKALDKMPPPVKPGRNKSKDKPV